MIRQIVAVCGLSACLWAADTGQAAKKKNRTGEATRTESLTGCVDQRGEGYFLAGSSMKEEAKLSGKAFTDDNFARYVGHTVTVRGSVDRSASPAVVQVVRIDDVKDTCRWSTASIPSAGTAPRMPTACRW